MIYFLNELKNRNELLYYFGLLCVIAALVFLLLTKISNAEVAGANAWFKPFKFALSTFLYAWAMAWYVWYLPSFNTKIFSWSVIILLGFEILYIAIQAARGQLSHYNLSNSFYSFMYMCMALAASAVTIYTAYIGTLFFTNEFPALPLYYLWGIRLGIFIFVVFSFQGFLMGSRLSHTIGGADGGPGIPIVNWSTKFGDPRIAHFIGMHALQILPLLSFYILKNSRLIIAAGLLYAALAVFTLVQALQGNPFIKSKKVYSNEIHS